MQHPYAQISRDLKGKCMDTIFEHFRKDFEASSIAEYDDITTDTPVITREGEDMINPDKLFKLDVYLLFGETRAGDRVIDAVREKGTFTKEEKEILREWGEQAFQSVFEIVEAVGDDSLKLLDTVGEAEYVVYSNDEQGMIGNDLVKPKHFLYTHLAPIHGVWFFSGVQSLLPPEAERTIYEKYVSKCLSPDMYRNNPEKLQRAFDFQKQEYDRFVKYFGSDEVLCSGKELEQKLKEYLDAWAKEFGKTPVYPPFPEIMLKRSDIGMVIDEKEGTNYLVEYGSFVKIFSNPERKPSDWKEVIEGYLKEDSIPAFVFRRMKDRYPEAFRDVMKEIVPSRLGFWKTDPVKEFDKIMDFFKRGWRSVYPSTHPISERFKKFAYQQKTNVGRNDPCPCHSGKKFKKCCGR